MKKILAWLLTLALVLSCCPILPLQAEAATAAATITFDDVAKRVTLTDDQQVWQENGITLTNNKANSTAAINGKYFAPIRMYANTEIVLEYPGMVGFDIDCNYTTYSDNLVKTLDTVADPSIASYTVDGNVVSVQFVSAVDSFTLALTAQVRANSITVYTAGEDVAVPSDPAEPEAPEAPETSDAPETSEVPSETANPDVPVATGTPEATTPNTPVEPEVPEDTTPDAPTEPETPSVPTTVVELVYAPDLGVAYKFAMNQVNLGKVLGITGEMSSYYYATSEVVDEMADVYVESAENGFHIYFLREDVKVYLNIIPRDNDATKVNAVMQTLEENAAPTAYHMNIEYKYVYTTVNDVDWYLGTYGTYTTVSASKTTYIEDTSKIGVSQFPAWFATVATVEVPVEPEVPEVPEEPETPTVPSASATYVFADYKIEGELGGAEFTRELDNTVTATISAGWFTTEARVYKNANIVFHSKEAMTSIVVNVGYKDSTFDVYVSDDGETWTLHQGTVAYTTAYSDITIELPDGCRYVKLDAPNAQIRLKSLTVNFAQNGSSTPEVPDTPVEPETPAAVVELVYKPEAGLAYKFVMNQVNLGKVLGITGEMSSYYYATSEVVDEMADVYVESAENGFHIYFLREDVKVYLNIIPRDNDATKVNAVMQTLEENAAPTAYHMNIEYKYVYTTVNDVDWYLGTYGTYTTVSASKTTYIEDTSKIGVSQFPAWFATVATSEEPEDPTVPEEPTVPEVPEVPETVVDFVYAPVAGVPYKFVLDQVALGKALGFTGEMSGYYYATSEVAEEMTDVYLEEAEGGYRIYCLVEGVKTYLNIIPRDTNATKVNVVLQTLEENTAPSVYVLNVEFRYVYTTINDVDWYLGTYGTYQTISASKTSYIEDTSKIGVSQFPVWFAVSDTEIPEEPEVPEVIVGDIDGNQLVNVDDAIYLLQYVLMPKLFPIDQPADFNADGIINEDDAIYLLQHVLMPDVFPL